MTIFPVDYDLWDSQMVADYLKVSKSHFMRRIAYLPDFPKAIRLPNINGGGHPRWKAIDVVKWVNEL